MSSLRTWQLLAVAGVSFIVGCSAPGSPMGGGRVLIPFEENGRWGYLDSTGAVVLRARYWAAGAFSEGVAPVRTGGLYGYVGLQGQQVLPAAYEYATPFRAGRAVVWQAGQLQLIDHAGRPAPLAAAYAQLTWHPGLDRGGVWVGTFSTYQRQLVAADGRALNPTQFVRVGALSSNRMVVVRTEPTATPDGPPETEAVAAVDGQGRLVIPYHRFDQISTFRGGLATAALYQPAADDQPAQECIIDTAGHILARLPRNQAFADYSAAEFADGVVRVHISEEGDEANPDNGYLAVVDQRGRVLFHNRRLQRLTNFYHGRAWAQEQDDDWYLIDKAGRRLSSVAVQRPLRPGGSDAAPAFAGGAEVVALARDAGYAALDSTGRVLRRLAEPAFPANPGDQTGDLLPLYAADNTGRIGFWNWSTGQVVPPRFSALNYAGYQHGLLAVLENDRMGYWLPAGRYAWQAAPARSTPLNLDAMRRAGYLVASPTLPRPTGAGGWGPSGNYSHPIGAPGFPASTLSVRVQAVAGPNVGGPHAHGHALTIANTTADTLVFDAQDSMLDLVVQARDPTGTWRDIEYRPSSFCGNSYHTVFLAPGRCWQLAVPAYVGSQPTRLRAKLVLCGAAKARPARIWYSNEFAGSVNPAQFWRRPGYAFSGDIMNPYLD